MAPQPLAENTAIEPMGPKILRSDNPFSDGASAYARHRPSYPAVFVDRLVGLCRSHSLALDIGCGTGQFSRLLAERFSQVIATDISRQQINQAVAHPLIDYRNESAEHIQIESGCADLIVAAQAAHWFDLPLFYKEITRVAAPSAIIALVTYGVPSIEGNLDSLLQHFYWHKIHRFWPPERRHVETGYADLDFPFDEVIMAGFSIERDWNLSQFIGYVKTWSAAKNAQREGASSLIEAFENEISDAWDDPDQTKRIKWPIAGRIGRITT